MLVSVITILYHFMFFRGCGRRLATAEELAKGASIAREGLEVPPPRVPAPSMLASRPSPANVMGPGRTIFLFSFFFLMICGLC